MKRLDNFIILIDKKYENKKHWDFDQSLLAYFKFYTEKKGVRSQVLFKNLKFQKINSFHSLSLLRCFL